MYCKLCFLLIASCIQISYSAAANKVDMTIKFPGPINAVSVKYGTENDVPDECKNKNFCTVKPKDYPQDTFNKLFKGTKQSVAPSLVIDDLDRHGDPGEVDDCATTVTYEPLYKVRSKRGDWRLVVQAPEENYVQMVRMEECTNPGGSCFSIFDPLPGYKVFCKQKYSVWEFLVSTENNQTEKIQSELPVCCSCHYKIVQV